MRSDDGLDVSSGVGGLAVDVVALQAQAAVLAAVARDVLSVTVRLAASGADPDVAVAGVLDPVGAARLHGATVTAAAGLLAAAGELSWLTGSLRLAAAAYAVADASAADLADALWSQVAGSVVGQTARAVVGVGLVVGAVAVAVVGTVTWVAVRTAQAAATGVGEALADAARGDLDPASLDDRARAELADLGDVLAQDAAVLGGHLGAFAASHPRLTEQVLSTVVTVGAVSVVGSLVWDATTPVTGLPPVPDDPAEAAAWVVLGASAVGVARQGPVRAEVVGAPRSVPGARGLADLVARLGPVTSPSPGHPVGRLPPEAYTPQRVRLDRTVPAGGGPPAWTVYVPPTQTWSTTGGPNPFDGTSNLVGFSGERADAGEAVLAAMRAAGVGPGEPVLLVGYSQGGLTAAQLASDDAVRAEFDVTSLVTIGSPVARADLPPSVQALSVQHEQDLVAALDGRSPPSTPTWTTASRDLLAGPAGERVEQQLTRDPWLPHRYDPYAETAALVDASTDESLEAWREHAAPFLGGTGTTTAVGVTVERTS